MHYKIADDLDHKKGFFNFIMIITYVEIHISFQFSDSQQMFKTFHKNQVSLKNSGLISPFCLLDEKERNL